ncbi:MAG: hypothetical protein N3C12_05260 [Candidatus Binatia bacterium]|nr:hypothetical protein [Candidatus Binatia bacterium]
MEEGGPSSAPGCPTSTRGLVDRVPGQENPQANHSDAMATTIPGRQRRTCALAAEGRQREFEIVFHGIVAL